VRLTRNIFKVN